MMPLRTSADIAERSAHYDAVVCVQGLGFVGAAMAIAVAQATKTDGSHPYLVVGVEADTPSGRERADSLLSGTLPFTVTDDRLKDALHSAIRRGNFITTCDPSVYAYADVAIVDVHLDVDLLASPATADLTSFRAAIQTLADRMPVGSMIIVETTVPPGTTTEVVTPIVRSALARRRLDVESIAVAHSYERVMPGPHHLGSIIDYWRVYAGVNAMAAARCRQFLESVLNTEEFPLCELPSPTASETAKILENTYRAVTIALMDEWGRFAEVLGIDLFGVIDVIRMRPTHVNIREPGLGVGGYCLTKDPLFAQVALNDVFNVEGIEFPMSSLALTINGAMPSASADRLARLLEGRLEERKILVMGASYRPDVDDTRHSPSQALVRELLARGAQVTVHDPIVSNGAFDSVPIANALPNPVEFDAIVLAVAHTAYADLDVGKWLLDFDGWILDSNHVLTDEQRRRIAERSPGRIFSVGRGFQ